MALPPKKSLACTKMAQVLYSFLMLNAAIAKAGFKFPDLWNPAFLAALPRGEVAGAATYDTRTQEASVRDDRRSETTRRLAQLRDEYYGLWSKANRQEAGLALESVLNELFRLTGLEPRRPFRVSGEQIDGSFDLDREIYLFEAKWTAERIGEGELLISRGKIEGKSQFTRGVFIAINGFTKTATEAITRGKQPNFFLMDGDDLSVVLQEGIPRPWVIENVF